MTSLTNYFQSKDQLSIHYHQWLPDTAPKGIVQIAHGLAEHAARYERFAIELTKAGYAVYANDHRGHGQSAGSPDKVGYFEKTPFWNAALADMHQLTEIVRKENTGLPIFLFGHSMGSLLTRAYITKWGKQLNGAIICATGGDPGMLGKIGGVVAKLTSMLSGKAERSDFLNKLSFGKYNDAFQPSRTDFDWLSRDEAEVDKYVADPYCGVPFTANFWIELLKGVSQINSASTYQQTPKDLPIILLAGDKDPVGDMAKGVNQVHESYKKVQINDLICTIYPDARHELLNETNRSDVMQDIINWLDQRA